MPDPIVTPVLLTKVNMATEQAWSKNQADIENTDVEAGTLDALIAHQQSASDNIVEKVTDPTKDYDVNITWYDFCGSEAVDCTQDPCTTITGSGNDVLSQQLNITSCIEDSFEIKETIFATTSLDPADYIARRQMRAVKNLLEKLNAKALAFLEANAGYNAGGQYPFAAGITSVPTADYNTLLMAKFLLDAKKSRIKNAFAIDGSGLFLPFTNAMLNAGNGEGKGDAARTKLFDVNFDILGMAEEGLGDTTFLVSPHAYAFMTKNYLAPTPTYDGTLDKTKYSFKIPGYDLTVDVWHQRTCLDGAKDRFKHVFLYKLHYDFFPNPAGCDDGNGNIVTGIAEYKMVA